MTQFIVDTHTHVYPQFEADVFFSCAYSNLDILNAGATKVLIVADTPQSLPITQIQCQEWQVKQTSEQTYRVKSRKFDHVIQLIMATQHVSSEGLEIISFNSSSLKDNLPLHSYTQDLPRGLMSYLPWGFGKWTGGRRRLIQNNAGSAIFGDSFGRPHLFDQKLLDNLSRSSKILLGGTDPLPMRGEEKIVGRYANLLEADDLLALREKDVWKNCSLVGSRADLVPAVLRQIRLRLQ